MRTKHILLTAAAMCLLCAGTRAVDFTYTGALDPETGAPLSASEAAASSRVVLSDTMYYDSESRLYVYPVGGGPSEVYATVADGMIVTEPVRVSASEGLPLSVKRDGEELDDPTAQEIAQIGQYIVSARDGDTPQRLFTFRIVGTTTNLAGGYAMPEGFFILSAERDGGDTYFERAFIGMEDEGNYHIEYICPDTGRRYTLETTVDRTPPKLTLEGRVDKKGRFHSAVRVGGLGEGDSVYMTRDGSSVRFPSDGVLTESGVYTLEAFDSAGNGSSCHFTILVYFDLNSLIFFALGCFSLVGVAGYVIYKRKRLRVG